MSPPPAFGTYRVLHQIGSGVLGPVFRAYDSHQDRLVAIKTFKLDLVPEDAARLADGLKTVAARPPADPAIVAGVEAGLDGATPYIALDYARGESLDVVIRQTGGSSVAGALPVLRGVARALDASWVQGVGHGGLHPRDIFVTAGATGVQLSGVGIGQALEAIGRRAPVRRPYSAPERAAGAHWDGRADTYSLAVIAYEMLSGHRPVGLDDGEEGVGQELTASEQAAVRRVLAVARAESPADRHESAIAFVDALASAAGEPLGVVAPEVAASPVSARADVPGAPITEPAVALLDSAFHSERNDSVPPLKEEAAPAPQPQRTPAAAAKIRRASSSVFHKPMELGTAPIAHGDFLAFQSEPEPETFPWGAVVAVLAAGLLLGAVGGYQFGWSRGSQATAGVKQVASVTNVVVPPSEVLPAAPDVTPVTTPALVPPAAPPVRATAPPPAPTGRLVIQSVPSGAMVTLDGQRAGETPLSLSTPVGRHELQIARSGYVPKMQTVDVTSRAAPHNVTVQLQAGRTSVPGTALKTGPGTGPGIATTGTVDIESRPRRAQITLDGRMVGETPLRVPELAPGDHRVQLALAGYKSVTSNVHIVSGELTKFAITLEQSELFVNALLKGHRSWTRF